MGLLPNDAKAAQEPSSEGRAELCPLLAHHLCVFILLGLQWGSIEVEVLRLELVLKVIITELKHASANEVISKGVVVPNLNFDSLVHGWSGEGKSELLVELGVPRVLNGLRLGCMASVTDLNLGISVEFVAFQGLQLFHFEDIE